MCLSSCHSHSIPRFPLHHGGIYPTVHNQARANGIQLTRHLFTASSNTMTPASPANKAPRQRTRRRRRQTDVSRGCHGRVTRLGRRHQDRKDKCVESLTWRKTTHFTHNRTNTGPKLGYHGWFGLPTHLPTHSLMINSRILSLRRSANCI